MNILQTLYTGFCTLITYIETGSQGPASKDSPQTNAALISLLGYTIFRSISEEGKGSSETTSAFFSSRDPIYILPLQRREDKNNGLSLTLPCFGRCIYIEEANRQAAETCVKLGLNPSQLLGSQLIHGSTSASLLAFTKYSNEKGLLIPTGMLLKENRVPFCGENGRGLEGINQTCISTVWVGKFIEVLPYCSSFTKQLFDMGIIRETKIIKSRNSHYTTLLPDEKDLVDNQFPVVYCIKPSRPYVCTPVHSDIDGEIGLLGGTIPGEIKVIMVPNDLRIISKVENLVKRHGISVLPFTHEIQKILDIHYARYSAAINGLCHAPQHLPSDQVKVEMENRLPGIGAIVG